MENKLCQYYLLPILLNPLYLVNLPYTNLLEIIILIIILIFFKQHKLSDFLSEIKKISYSFKIPVILILLGIILSILVNQSYLLGASILKSWFILPIIYALIIYYLVQKRLINKHLILKIIFYSGVLISIISLLYLISNNLTFDSRLKAFYLSPNHLSMILTPSIIIGFFYPPQLRENEKRYFLHLILLALQITIIHFTFSYGAWLAILFSVILTKSLPHLNIRKNNTHKKINRQKLFYYISSFLITFLLLIILIFPTNKFQDLINFNERSSASSRLMIWKSAIKLIDDNFIFGIGPGIFQEKYLEYQKFFPPYLEWAVPHPHNIFLAFWLYCGLLGLIGFICLIFAFLKNIFLQIKTKKNWINLSLCAIFLATIIHGLIETPIWKNDLAIIFWIIIFLTIKKFINLQEIKTTRF